MYTNSFSVIEIEGGAGFTDQAITIILEPFRIRILVLFSTKIHKNPKTDFSAYFHAFLVPFENDIKQIKILLGKLISQDLKGSAPKSQIIRIEIYSYYMFPKKKILSFGLCQFLLEKHLSIYSGLISTIYFPRRTTRMVWDTRTDRQLFAPWISGF